MRRTMFRFAIPVALLALAVSVAARAAGDAKAAGSPQAKAYETLLKAVESGDYEGYKKSMTKAAAEGIDKETKEMGLDPKKAMGMLKDLSPTDLEYTSLKVDGKKATLEATGRVGGETNWGTIELEQEDGQWKVANQSWTNTKK
jgi:hypothetical protein